LAVAQVLPGVRSQVRWLRFVPRHLPGAFVYLPQQSGYNKRLRAAVLLLERIIRLPTTDTGLCTGKLDAHLTERGVRLPRPSYRNDSSP
jgi:hypothetical protein